MAHCCSWRWGAAPLILLWVFAVACNHPDERPATWSYVHAAILEPSCATSSCHSELADTAGIRFDDPNLAYEALLERQFVLPGDPDSPLIFLLEGNERDRMPPDAPLPKADVDLVADWIAQGAAP